VAVLRLHDTRVGLVLSVFGTGQWASLDPYAGAAAAVVLAASRLAALGAEPLGLTDGINAGNPDKEESFRQMASAVAGVQDAAEALRIPVTGGNVSLHNETDGQPIWPTVMIGALGRLDDATKPVPDCVGAQGHALYLVNPGPLHWGGSVAERVVEGASPYPLGDLGHHQRALEAMTQFVRRGLAQAVRAIGRGGLATALARMLLGAPPSLGMAILLSESTESEKLLRLFNEGPAQWVVAVAPEVVDDALGYWQAVGIEVRYLGEVTQSGQLEVDERVHWTRAELLTAWRQRG
jgi:phosphoribosylformylglycinamidine synthase